jgi:hypothetical protein
MNRFPVVVAAVLGLVLSAGAAHAGWSELTYSGYQPWWNTFAHRNKDMTPEEERLQKFWHDYYDGLKNYYQALDHIDWADHYKKHGYEVKGTCPGGCSNGCCPRINYAPVSGSPTLQWAGPNGPMGPPAPTPPAAGR